MLHFRKLTKTAVANNSGAMESRDHFKNGAKLKSHTSRNNFISNSMIKKITFLFATFLTANYAYSQAYYGGYDGGYSSGTNFNSVFSILGGIIVIIITIFIIRMIIRWGSKKAKKTSGADFMTPPNMGMRGKSKEHKKIVKYFMSTGILGMIFRISNSTFDNLLNRKADEVVSRIEDRALEAHGMDADEVKETSPILVENYYHGSRYFKMFRDFTFRASEYQMTYLMFSQKQVYTYSYIFDLTSDETSEQTNEYFYEDITNVEVAKVQKEWPTPRPMEYIIGGIACIVIGLLIMTLARGAGALFGGLLFLIPGIIIAAFLGYSRRIVENLILRLTVAGDEFVCAMKPENINAIQGMKAKIREKKK